MDPLLWNENLLAYTLKIDPDAGKKLLGGGGKSDNFKL